MSRLFKSSKVFGVTAANNCCKLQNICHLNLTAACFFACLKLKKYADVNHIWLRCNWDQSGCSVWQKLIGCDIFGKTSQIKNVTGHLISENMVIVIVLMQAVQCQDGLHEKHFLPLFPCPSYSCCVYSCWPQHVRSLKSVTKSTM